MPSLLFHLLLVAVSLAEPSAGKKLQLDPAICQKSIACGDNVDVRYPFFLGKADGTASSYCGYPGMAIACEGGRATLRLKGDSYTVLDIDYENHTITVAAEEVLGGGGCPRVTHNVTIPTETWLNLSATANDNLTFFFGCAFTGGVAPPLDIPPINCSSFPERDGVSYVAALSDVASTDQLPWACREVVVAPVLKVKDRLLGGSDDEYPPRLNSDGYGKVLKQGFQLTWGPSAGQCFLCEKSGGQCSYYSPRGQFVGCLCSDGRVRDEECGGTRNSR